METKELELGERRAIIAIPKGTVRIDIEATVDLDGKLEHVSKSMTSRDVYDAFRRAADGYLHEDEITGWPVRCADGESFALVYLPEASVAVTLLMTQMVNHNECPPLKYDLDLSDLCSVFTEADRYYIDEDDRFELTEKGYEYLEQNGKTC